MKHQTLARQHSEAAPIATEQSRQRLVKAVIAFTEGTALFPEPYEQQLLDQFVRGRLTIDEVVYYLEAQANFNFPEVSCPR